MNKIFKFNSIFGSVGLVSLLVWLLVAANIECGHEKVDNEGLYKLLNIPKTANTKEIRIAFKKLALIKHPDKNTDDPNANEVFIEINRAYEILKDEDLRKKYDTFGEDGLKENHNAGQQYQNWNFYQHNFGIYDDDPEVVTLTRTDFVQMVESNSDIIWFINFYSTHCSHCHDLAPAWRELAKQLDGVIRIGAVNCGDDWMLCNQQQIRSFPSLIMFPKRVRFEQEKSLEKMMNFALKFAKGKVSSLNTINQYSHELANQNKAASKKPWLITYCLQSDNEAAEDDATELNYELNCLDDTIKLKIAISLDGLVNVGSIDCTNDKTKNEICSKLKPSRSNPILLYPSLPDIETTNNNDIKRDTKPITTTDYKQILRSILLDLPEENLLDEKSLNRILDNLRNPNKYEKTWLIQFVSDFKSDQDLELKKLPSLFGADFNFGRVDCSKLFNPRDCFIRFQVHKLPTFVLFKSASYQLGGPVHMKENWYEIYYNQRAGVPDLVAFTKDNAYTSVRSLNDFQDGEPLEELLNDEEKEGYFVDFFAPWCPPCMNLLPEFRKSSKTNYNQKAIKFGTVDCTVNQQLCANFGIQSYPTTLFFHKSQRHQFVGQHSSQDMDDFLQDVINPVVVVLTYDSFHELVKTKPVGKVWLVDFYASWCGPCQQLAPEWRKLGKRLNQKVASIGMVDCVTEQRLCSEQGITSYPNIRVYPSNSKGTEQFVQYQNWMRDANNLYQWASNYFPTKTVMLDMNNFEKLVLKGNNKLPWLIDFYAPWCGPCNQFAPKFEEIAERLEGRVRCGKVNCQEHQFLCQRAGITGYPSIVFYKNIKSNWNSGEKIFQYETDTVLHEVNSKLQKQIKSKDEL